jgi:hypothetical protein
MSSDGDGRSWVRFFVDYFPSGRNVTDDAQLLWDQWRVGLLKDRTPRHGVAITHGQPVTHWQRDSFGALVIDLESMWDDFEHATDGFVRSLRSDARRAVVALRRWRARTWTVRPFRQLQQRPRPGAPGGTFYLPIGSTMAVTGSDITVPEGP